ncbi:nucleoporin-62 C-terminal-like protein [Neophocaena asiaeorientalis asiaeorientalis]|uniref:Nucleoporin-62 C-terminal-like protein n=1 Tax=Neophocaena asiaeorientalis asiaeorientalis TaxID=1706337 RepID=A0A341AX26_NEOAA|nr:nucleoporin-62 C-terminal-like protein [Neophocaena asiaeorientalis asiaeorientalis]
MGLAVTWQREFQDVSSVSAERLNSHGYREAYLDFMFCHSPLPFDGYSPTTYNTYSPNQPLPGSQHRSSGEAPTAQAGSSRPQKFRVCLSGRSAVLTAFAFTSQPPELQPPPVFVCSGNQQAPSLLLSSCTCILDWTASCPADPEQRGQKGLVPASTVATATSSSTMLFTSFSNVSTSTAATGLSFGASTTLAGMLGGTALGFGLNFPGAGGAAAVASTTTSTITTTTVTTTSTSTSTTSSFTMNLKPLTSTGVNNTVPFGMIPKPFTLTISEIITPVMTYGQLSGLVNKWSLELEDQEKHFLHQVTQVNAWDYTLIENGETIIALHGEVQKVKQDQKRLEQELYFILSQQKELEDLLTPLEESVKDESGSVCLQHTDEERERIYQLAEDVYAQLKRTAQDLKDIIEYLNTFGSPADTTGPVC